MNVFATEKSTEACQKQLDRLPTGRSRGPHHHYITAPVPIGTRRRNLSPPHSRTFAESHLEIILESNSLAHVNSKAPTKWFSEFASPASATHTTPSTTSSLPRLGTWSPLTSEHAQQPTSPGAVFQAFQIPNSN